MEIILKQDIHKLGHKHELVTVKDGFGRNYLIPKGYAIQATPSSIKMTQEMKKQQAHKEEKLRTSAQDIAKKLETVELIIGAKTSSTGKIFGSVNTIQIAEALSKKGIDIDRKTITIDGEAIKTVGKFTAKVKLHRDVIVEIPFEVIAE